MMTNAATRFATLLGALCLPGASFAASPYLPEPGKLQVNLTYTHDRYSKFKAGKTTDSLPGTLLQHSFLPSLSYGLSPKLAFDFNTSYTHASLPEITLSAVVNTSYALRLQAFRNDRVTIALRGGGIRSELYPIDLGPVPTGGVSVNGFTSSVIAGFTLPKRTFAIVDIGYLIYQKPVHDRFVSSVFLGQSRGRFTYYAGYQDNRAVNGIDIPNLAAARNRFAEYRRVIGTFDAGGGYTLKRGLYLGATYSRWVTARNAPQSNSIAVTVAFNVPGKGPSW